MFHEPRIESYDLPPSSGQDAQYRYASPTSYNNKEVGAKETARVFCCISPLLYVVNVSI